jgi:hypothetical protein
MLTPSGTDVMTAAAIAGAVNEVVERIADDDREHTAVVHFAIVRVTVSPQHKLFEQEEQKDADEQRAEDARRRELRER